MKQQELIQIAKRRKLIKHEPDKLKEDREKWLSRLRVYSDYGALKFGEMWKFGGEVHKTKFDYVLYRYEAEFINTRLKLPSEVDFEVDIEDYEKAFEIIIEVCQALKRNNIHFAVFYADGQRSPHIRSYDFEELGNLEPFVREQVEQMFWKRITPQFWKFCDKGVWSAGHELQLEFSIHYKHATPFDLLFEYIPKPKKIETEKPLFKVKVDFWNVADTNEVFEKVKGEIKQFKQFNFCSKCDVQGFKNVHKILVCPSCDNEIKQEVQYATLTKFNSR